MAHLGVENGVCHPNRPETDDDLRLIPLNNFSSINCQDHGILITKLSDMGVLHWLQKLVTAFLTKWKMVVRYNAAVSAPKELPVEGTRRKSFYVFFYTWTPIRM